LDTQQRDQAMNNFLSGKCKVLITTNILARGFDYEQINLVINFDLPSIYNTDKVDLPTYLHRIGRTGRFGRNGIAINIISIENAIEYDWIKTIEKH